MRVIKNFKSGFVNIKLSYKVKTLDEITRKVNVHGEERGTRTELWGSSTLRNQKGAINEVEKNMCGFSEFE